MVAVDSFVAECYRGGSSGSLAAAGSSAVAAMMAGGKKKQQSTKNCGGNSDRNGVCNDLRYTAFF
jgi:hypothetical protein